MSGLFISICGHFWRTKSDQTHLEKFVGFCNEIGDNLFVVPFCLQ